MNASPALPRRRFVPVFLLLGLLCYALALWPLPRHFASAIPIVDGADETTAVRPALPRPGDNLQLLYHFWLGLDALSGHSPPLSNIYEFNLGDDSVRFQPDLYYLPFSAVFVLCAPLLGPAAAWNLSGLASYLAGLALLYLLARRLAPGPRRAPAVLAALLASVLPYRFLTLACGSPTGFAIALPPLLAYGIDRAIRDRSPLGWALALLALFFSYAADLHVFYFSALAAPFFCILSLLLHAPAPRDWPPAIGRTFRALLPVLPLALLLVAGIAALTLLAHRHLSGSSLHSGRTIFEMASYSPRADGLFDPAATGMARHVYLGWPLLALLLLSPLLGGRLARATPDAPHVPRIPVILLLLAILATVLLALGIHAPPAGLWVRAARKLVPMYSMIRQTVKIYCLLPVFVAPLLALSFRPIFAARTTPAAPGATRLLARLAPVFVVLFVVLSALGNLHHIRPVLVNLPARAPALDALSADADARSDSAPIALAIPIWPGDSHWSSFYEYDALLSRIRFINGYSPAAPADYMDSVFRRLESVNQGYVTDDQLDFLLSFGCRYILFYPHAFPENVSPWPPAYTLRGLMRHPRLRRLIADDLPDAPATVAFRILTADEADAAPLPHPSPDPDATLPRPSALHYLFPSPTPLDTPQRLKLRAPIFPAPRLRYELLISHPQDAQALPIPPPDAPPDADLPTPRTPSSDDHHTPYSTLFPDIFVPWSTLPVLSPYGIRLSSREEAGTAPAIRHAYLAAGPDWRPRLPDYAYAFPPNLLWNAGRPGTDPGTLTFPPSSTPPGLVLYGPNLPLPADTYVPVIRHTPLPAADLATFQFRHFRAPSPLASAPILPGTTETWLPPVTLSASSLPIRFELHLSPAYADLPPDAPPLTVTDLFLLRPYGRGRAHIHNDQALLPLPPLPYLISPPYDILFPSADAEDLLPLYFSFLPLVPRLTGCPSLF